MTTHGTGGAASKLPYRPGINRRRFLLTSLAGAVAGPLAAEAQRAGKVARVGFVITTSLLSEMSGPEPSNPLTRHLLTALGAAGWVEGRNLIFERRSAEGRFERFGDILPELVGVPCDVIVTTGVEMTAEALRVTSTVPIVFTAVDPITAGFVTALARQDRNITGMMGPDRKSRASDWRCCGRLCRRPAAWRCWSSPCPGVARTGRRYVTLPPLWDQPALLGVWAERLLADLRRDQAGTP